MLTESRVVLIFEILSIKNVLNLLGKFSAGVSDGNVRLLCLPVSLLKIENKVLEFDEDVI